MTSQIEISSDGETVEVGDTFEVLEQRTALLPGRPVEGTEMEVMEIRMDMPNAPELVVEYGENDGIGDEQPMSPTSLAEALCTVDYLDDDAEPCLQRTN